MDRHDIGHRFANQDFGKNGHLTAGNVRVEGRNYYSYSTVFGQWVDLEKKVCLVYNGNTSISSSKHQLGQYAFPSDVHVFPYDDSWSDRRGYGYHGCRLLYWGDEEFTERERYSLIDYWVHVQFCEFKAINGGTSKGLEKVSYEYWDYVEELCGLYKDTSVNKYLKHKTGSNDKEQQQKNRMVRLLLSGERNVRTITDKLFGEGVFQKYVDYCERFRRADRKKEQMEWLCNRLLISSPYDKHCGSREVSCDLSAQQIRKLTAKERIDIHFSNIAHLEWRSHEDERKRQYKQRKRNAYGYIVGSEPVIKEDYYGSYKAPEMVVNRFTGEVYKLRKNFYRHYNSFEGASIYLDFDFDAFRKSESKEEWIRDFYAKCAEVAFSIEAQDICQRVGAHTKNGKYSWVSFYIDDEFLTSVATPAEYEICKKYIAIQDKYLADEAARERAAAIRRQREEEERRREKELQEQLKAEQIEKCLSEGVEGGRNLWRYHYMDISEAKRRADIPDFQFYDGGNVLMRFGMKKDIVETSMHIKLDIPTCKKFWRLINIWHKDPSKFKECKIDTHFSGTYTIVSYEDDILTAGCHKIAYAEMERMYNSIIEQEKIAV